MGVVKELKQKLKGWFSQPEHQSEEEGSNLEDAATPSSAGGPGGGGCTHGRHTPTAFRANEHDAFEYYLFEFLMPGTLDFLWETLPGSGTAAAAVRNSGLEGKASRIADGCEPSRAEQLLISPELEDAVKHTQGLFSEIFTAKAGNGSNVAATITEGMNMICKCVPLPLATALKPLGAVMGAVFERVLLVTTNKKNVQQLSKRVVEAARTIGELLLCIAKAEDPRGACRTIEGGILELTKLLEGDAMPFLEHFCESDRVKKMWKGKTDQVKFEELDTGIVELLKMMGSAVGRSNLSTTMQVYDMVEENPEISKATHACVKENTILKNQLKLAQEMLSRISSEESKLRHSHRAFASLRFHGVVPEHAEKLQAAMWSKGVNLHIVNEKGGGDIDRAVIEGILAADYFIVFGSVKYGEDTGNPVSTYYESKFAQHQKKKIILIRMIPYDQQFEYPRGKFMFGIGMLELRWMLGAPMPTELPGKVLEAMGLTGGGEVAASITDVAKVNATADVGEDELLDKSSNVAASIMMVAGAEARAGVDKDELVEEIHSHVCDRNTPRTSNDCKIWLEVAIDPPPHICVQNSRLRGVSRHSDGICKLLKREKCLHDLRRNRNLPIQFSDSAELQSSVGGAHVVLWLSLGSNCLKLSEADNKTDIERVKEALEALHSSERPTLFIICMKYGARRAAKALAPLVPVIWMREDLVSNRGRSLIPGGTQFRYVAEKVVPTLHKILAGKPPLTLKNAAINLQRTAHDLGLKECIAQTEDFLGALPQTEYIVQRDPPDEFRCNFNDDCFHDLAKGRVDELLCQDVKDVNHVCKEIEESGDLRLHLVSNGSSHGRLRSVARHVLEAHSLEHQYTSICHFRTVEEFEDFGVREDPTLVWLDLLRDIPEQACLTKLLEDWEDEGGILALILTTKSDWDAGDLFRQSKICTGDGKCSTVSEVHEELSLYYLSESTGHGANLNYYKRSELTGMVYRAVKSKHEELFLAGVFEGNEEGQLVLRVWMSSIDLLNSLRDDILSNDFAARLTKEAQELVSSEERRPGLGRTARLAGSLTGAFKDLPPSSSSEAAEEKIGTTGEPSTTQEAQEFVSSEERRPGLGHASTVRLASGLAGALEDLPLSSSSEAAEQKIGTTAELSTAQSPPIQEKLEVKVDLTAFAKSYESSILQLDKLTPHQEEKLSDALEFIGNGQSLLHIKGPAGAGKTFVALHLILKMLHKGPVLFVTRTPALCYFLVNWTTQRLEGGDEPVELLKQLHVLHTPFKEGPKTLNLDENSNMVEFVPFKAPGQSTPANYSLVVVDEAHHVYNDPNVAHIGAYTSGLTPLLLLSDLSQSNDSSKVNFPKKETTVVELTEVVRSSKRILSAASAFQNKAEGHSKYTTCSHQSQGPPLKTFLFDLEEATARKAYSKWTLEALDGIRKDFMGLSLHGRLAILVRDDKMREALKEDMAEKLKADGLELVNAERSCAACIRSSQAEQIGKEWLLLDTVDNVDGLERLMVICVGLDTPIEGNSDGLGTRSQLYRAITRAHMLVVVVNELLPNGWLTFLTKVRLKEDAKFDKDEALAESLQATKRAEAEAALQKKREEDAEVAFEESGLNAEVDIGLLLPQATALMRGGQPANAAVMQAFKQWQLEQDLATLPNLAACISDTAKSITCTRSLVQSARAAVRSGSKPETAIAHAWTQWQELSALTEELILGSVDATNARQVKELETLIAEAAALTVQKYKASTRDAIFETMRLWLQRHSVSKIPTFLQRALVENSSSVSKVLRAAVTELAESLLRSSESGALIPAALEIEPLPGPSLLREMPRDLTAKAVQTALVQKEQCMKCVAETSSLLGIEPSNEQSRDQWCSLALGSLHSVAPQTVETTLGVVCEALIPPLVKMDSMELDKAAQRLVEESAKKRFQDDLFLQHYTLPDIFPLDHASQLVECVRNVCAGVQNEWMDIQAAVGKHLKGTTIEDSAADIELAVARVHFSRDANTLSLEKLVEAEVSNHRTAVDQAVWDTAANTTTKYVGPFAFNPYRETMEEQQEAAEEEKEEGEEVVEEEEEEADVTDFYDLVAAYVEGSKMEIHPLKVVEAMGKDPNSFGKVSSDIAAPPTTLENVPDSSQEIVMQPSSRRAFASLRFDGVVPAHAEKLQAAMRSKGADLQIVNTEGGGDISDAVFGGILAVDNFIVFGSAKYGENTGNPTSTYHESKFAMNHKKRIILIRMISFDEEFDFQQGKYLFGIDKPELVWMLGEPMPAELPGKVLKAMGLTVHGDD